MIVMTEMFNILDRFRLYKALDIAEAGPVFLLQTEEGKERPGTDTRYL